MKWKTVSLSEESPFEHGFILLTLHAEKVRSCVNCQALLVCSWCQSGEITRGRSKSDISFLDTAAGGCPWFLPA